MAYDAGIKPEGAPERSVIAGGGARINDHIMPKIRD